MKVKLYKGSQHGKTLSIDPRLFWRGLKFRKAHPLGLDPSPLAMVTWDEEVYEPVMMSVTLDGVFYRAPAMHPDGSLFLVKKN